MTQHHSVLAHHFDTLEQQKEAATLGMWTFLATEIMLFGGVFLAYTIYRGAYPEVFAAGAHHLNLVLGTINTVVLLCSSLTVALAVYSAEHGNRNRMVLLLLATIALGLTFMVIKAFEYGEKFSHCFDAQSHECLVPGEWFKWPAEEGGTGVAVGAESGAGHGAAAEGAGEAEGHGEGAQTPGQGTAIRPNSSVVAPPIVEIPREERRYQLFFILYFLATGLHALHMIIGTTLIGVIAWIGWRGGIPPEKTTLVENGGLYWHLIDIVWVFLFPLFYLIH